MVSDSVAIGVGTSLGLGALILVAGAILVHKHRQDIKRLRAAELEAQARAAHAVANDLPPEYIDHVHDPVCIYEHELPPEAVAQVQPILVHATSNDQIVIPADEDPLLSSSIASSSPLPGAVLPTSSIGPIPETPSRPATASSSPFSHPPLAHHSSSTASFASTIATATTDTYETTNNTTPAAATPMHSPYMASFVSDLGIVQSPSALSLASSSAYTQSSLELELEELASLPPPPSYDTPNRVVEVSPLPMPATAFIPMTDYFDPRAMSSGQHYQHLPPSLPHSPIHPGMLHRARARAHSDVADYHLYSHSPRSQSPTVPYIHRTESTSSLRNGGNSRFSLPRSLRGSPLRRSGTSGYSTPPPSWPSTLPAPAVADIHGSRNGSVRARASTVGSEASPRLWVQQIRRAFAQQRASSSASSSTTSLAISSMPSTPAMDSSSPVVQSDSVAAVEELNGIDQVVVNMEQEQQQNQPINVGSTSEQSSSSSTSSTEEDTSVDQPPDESEEEEVEEEGYAGRQATVMNTAANVIPSQPLQADPHLVTGLAISTLALLAA